MNLRALFVAMFSFLSPTTIAQEIELLSKDDTRAMFSMTRSQWDSNVQGNVAAGQAKAMGTPATGLAMVMMTPEAQIIVKPDYSSNEQKPSFIQVTIGYRDPKVTIILKGEVLNSAIQTARTQLAPEYDVNANFEHIQNRLVIYFFITQKGQ